MHDKMRSKSKSKINGATNSALNIVGIFDDGYYGFNKRLLGYIGLWPHQNTFKPDMKIVFLAITSISLLVPQLLKLVHSWGEISIFIECLSPTVANLLFWFKYFCCVVHMQKVRRLIDEVQEDWECTRCMPELKILQEHGRKGRFYTAAYFVMIYIALAGWTALPLVPVFMDIVAPLNESRPHVIFFQTDYRVDPDKYFYPIFVHGCLSAAVGMLVYVAIDTFFMVLAQHACAMINILRYRLENMVREDNKVNIRLNTNDRDIFYHQQIIDCMQRHKRSMEYIKDIQTICEWYLVFAIFFNVIVISCTGSQIIAKGTSKGVILRFLFFALAQLIHLFCNSLPGHWIMDTSSLLQNSIYSCRWYLMSPRSRKLLVLFILRSKEPCTIIAGKMYVVSMESFRCVLQTSMSYLTLLSSMQ